MVGEMNLQQLQTLVDSIDQAATVGQRVDRPNTTNADAPAPVRNFIVDVAGGHDGFGTTVEVGFVQAALDTALAVGQFLSYDLLHSKSLPVFDCGDNGYAIRHRKRRGVSSFFRNTFRRLQGYSLA